MLILLVLCISGGGCSQDLPLDPITTNESDWAPFGSIIKNDYQRLRLQIEKPPRKELLRNIDSYIIEVRFPDSDLFSPLDTIPGTWIPPKYYYPQYTYYYDTKPRLLYNTDYGMRIGVKYKSGMTTYSEDYPFATPPERGRVLRHISLSMESSYATSLAFHKSDLLIIQNDRIFRVDTTTGQITKIKDYFRPPPNSDDLSINRTIAVVGDTLVSIYYDRNAQHYMIAQLDLQTLAVDTSIKFPKGDKYLQSYTSHGASLLLFWYGPLEREQLTILDPKTGRTIKEYPATARRIEYPHTIASDGNNFWHATGSEFATQINRFDPVDFSFLETHRNPIFHPLGLAWDGAHFWVIDQETRTLAKLKLEGF